MSARRARSSLWIRVAGVLATVLTVTGAIAAPRIVERAGRGAAAVETDGVRYAIERDGLRYEFQAVLGSETLHSVADPAPRRNLLRERPDDAAALRRLLVESQGVPRIEDLRERHRATIASLRRLGYL